MTSASFRDITAGNMAPHPKFLSTHTLLWRHVSSGRLGNASMLVCATGRNGMQLCLALRENQFGALQNWFFCMFIFSIIPSASAYTLVVFSKVMVKFCIALSGGIHLANGFA